MKLEARLKYGSFHSPNLDLFFSPQFPPGPQIGVKRDPTFIFSIAMILIPPLVSRILLLIWPSFASPCDGGSSVCLFTYRPRVLLSATRVSLLSPPTTQAPLLVLIFDITERCCVRAHRFPYKNLSVRLPTKSVPGFNKVWSRSRSLPVHLFFLSRSLKKNPSFRALGTPPLSSL